jgi:hypothetical protein
MDNIKKIAYTFLFFLSCIPGDVLQDTAISFVLTSSSQIVSCDTISPFANILDLGHQSIEFVEIANDPNWNESICYRKWKIDGNPFVNNSIIIGIHILDSVVILDTINLTKWDEFNFGVHIGKKSYLSESTVKIPLDAFDPQISDTLFVEETTMGHFQ